MVLFSLFTGTVAGILAGMFGIGGGLIIVPALLFLFVQGGFPESIAMHSAVGTALAAIAVNGLVSSASHIRLRHVSRSDFVWLAPAVTIGAVLGGSAAHHIAADRLQILFALFTVCVAGRMLFSYRRTRVHAVVAFRTHTWLHVLVGCGVGSLSALIGIGGGTMTVPYLRMLGRDMRLAIGTSAVCGVCLATAGALSFMWFGRFITLPMLEHMIGYIYWPAWVALAIAGSLSAPIGAWLTAIMPAVLLERLFAALLLLCGVYLLFERI